MQPINWAAMTREDFNREGEAFQKEKQARKRELDALDGPKRGRKPKEEIEEYEIDAEAAQ